MDLGFAIRLRADSTIHLETIESKNMEYYGRIAKIYGSRLPKNRTVNTNAFRIPNSHVILEICPIAFRFFQQAVPPLAGT